MTSLAHLVPFRAGDPALRLDRALRCPSSFYRYLYAAVGEAYHWVDRRDWSDGRIREHLDRDAVALFVLYAAGAPAGYFELETHGDGSIEIAYFGLLPEYHGRGYGKHLLTAATERAFGKGTSRVWVHTCTLDGPAALPNYRARGFRPFRQETYFISAAPA
jgi:ribosomal protein S18 acetylase RimI-like enzyme